MDNQTQNRALEDRLLKTENMVDDQNDMLSEAFNDLKETNNIMGSANQNLSGQRTKLQQSKSLVIPIFN